MSWQLFDTFGILIGSLTNLAIYSRNPDHPNWRFMLALPFISSLMFLTLAFFCVESPRWLLKADKTMEALSALIRLHDLPSPIIACGQLYDQFDQLKEEESKYLKLLKDREMKRNWLSKLLLKWTGHLVDEETGSGEFLSYRTGMVYNKTVGIQLHPIGRSDDQDGHHSSAIDTDNPNQSAISGNPRRRSTLAGHSDARAPEIQSEPVCGQSLLRTSLLDRVCLLLLVPRMRQCVHSLRPLLLKC